MVGDLSVVGVLLWGSEGREVNLERRFQVCDYRKWVLKTWYIARYVYFVHEVLMILGSLGSAFESTCI